MTSVPVDRVDVVPPATDLLPRTGTGTREPGWWGMLCFCISEVALFMYFLGAYFYLRGTVRSFGAGGGHAPALLIPLVLTALLVSSSVTLWWGEQGIKRGDQGRLIAGMALTLLLGVAFLVLQGLEYAREEHMPQTDAYWSTFYTITGFHGAHVFLGLLFITFNLLRSTRGHFTRDRHLAVQNASLYWHTVDAIWIAIVASLYLAPHLW